eukprot:jgi/Bigna1/68253/fgenesh1_pg.5_\
MSALLLLALASLHLQANARVDSQKRSSAMLDLSSESSHLPVVNHSLHHSRKGSRNHNHYIQRKGHSNMTVYGQPPPIVHGDSICTELTVNIGGIFSVVASMGLEVKYGGVKDGQNQYAISGFGGLELKVGASILSISLAMRGDVEMEFLGPKNLNSPAAVAAWALRKYAYNHLQDTGLIKVLALANSTADDLNNLENHVTAASTGDTYNPRLLQRAFKSLYVQFAYNVIFAFGSKHKTNLYNPLHDAFEKAKKNSTLANKEMIYIEAMERIWSGVYLGVDRVGDSDANFVMDKFSCKDVSVNMKNNQFVHPTTDKMDQDHYLQAAKRVCILFKSPIVLGADRSTKFRDTNKENENIKLNLIRFFPELFPPASLSDEDKASCANNKHMLCSSDRYEGTYVGYFNQGKFTETVQREALYQKLKKENKVKMDGANWKGVVPMSYGMGVAMSQSLSELDKPTKPNTNLYWVIVHGMMALTPSRMKEAFNSKLTADAGCTGKCTCRLDKVTLKVEFGVSIGGGSPVCSADNPLLLSAGYAREATTDTSTCELGEFQQGSWTYALAINPIDALSFKGEFPADGSGWKISTAILGPKPTVPPGTWAAVEKAGQAALIDLGKALTKSAMSLGELAMKKELTLESSGPILNAFFADVESGVKKAAKSGGKGMLAYLTGAGGGESGIFIGLAGKLGNLVGKVSPVTFETSNLIGLEIEISKEGDDPVTITFNYLTSKELKFGTAPIPVGPGVAVGVKGFGASETSQKLYETSFS